MLSPVVARGYHYHVISNAIIGATGKCSPKSERLVSYQEDAVVKLQ